MTKCRQNLDTFIMTYNVEFHILPTCVRSVSWGVTCSEFMSWHVQIPLQSRTKTFTCPHTPRSARPILIIIWQVDAAKMRLTSRPQLDVGWVRDGVMGIHFKECVTVSRSHSSRHVTDQGFLVYLFWSVHGSHRKASLAVWPNQACLVLFCIQLMTHKLSM